jgi:hypothetical protein
MSPGRKSFHSKNKRCNLSSAFIQTTVPLLGTRDPPPSHNITPKRTRTNPTP